MLWPISCGEAWPCGPNLIEVDAAAKTLLENKRHRSAIGPMSGMCRVKEGRGCLGHAATLRFQISPIKCGRPHLMGICDGHFVGIYAVSGWIPSGAENRVLNAT
jgi:hypothetical protein